MAEIPSSTSADDWVRRYQQSRGARTDHAKSQPYLSIHGIVVYVRDQDESLRFYVDKLGFQLVVDAPIDSESRWVAVVPPDGSSILALIKPRQGSKESSRIGCLTGVILATEDIAAKFTPVRQPILELSLEP